MRRRFTAPPACHRLALLALVVLPVTTGCSLAGSTPPGPGPSADTVATALGDADLRRVDFDGLTGAAAQRQVAPVLAALRSFPARVRTEGVTARGDRAQGTLTWTRTVAGRAWVTRSPITLVRRNETWRVLFSPRLVLPTLSAGGTVTVSSVAAPRADILGGRGKRLVTARPVVRYGIDKSHVPLREAVASARSLARLVHVDARGFAARVRSAGPQAFVEAVTLRADSPAQPSQSSVLRLGGGAVLAGVLPLPPTREFAAPILGVMGEPTAEMIRGSQGRLKIGDQVGIGGLQERYDARLAGTPGVRIDLVPHTGKPRTLFTAPARRGQPLRTSLDLDAQLLAESVLARTASPSALVAIRPSTGDILAAATGPAPTSQNLATYGQYAPGSTFKVVSSLALLRAGVRPDTVVDCPPSLRVDGKLFTNYSDYPASGVGRIPFRTAIANSCNTAVIGLRSKLTRTSVSQAAAALGLGVDHDLGFPAYFGAAPVPASRTEAAADLIGQGRVLASPLAMATVAASVQHGGTVVPHLLADARPTAAPRSPLTAGEATALRALMRGVVTDGSGRLLLGVPGPAVGAKTGTAEYGTGRRLRTHAWMIAYHGDLAVAVFVETGSSGSGTAGPLLERFLRGVR